MKAASLSEIKKALKNVSPEEIMAFCLRMAKHKKENKELLTYLLFEQEDEKSYMEHIKSAMDEMMQEMQLIRLYQAKKSIRKLLRETNKYIRYSGQKETEVALLLHFCVLLKNSGLTLRQSSVLSNLYQRQIVKIGKAMEKLHEDLRFDYQEELEDVSVYR